MSLASALLSVLLAQVAPGGSTFSVEPVSECAGAESCPDARWSSFYGTWVRRESRASAERRYDGIVQAAVVTAGELLCLGEQDETRPDCTPYPGARDKRGLRWDKDELAAMALAVAVIESGLREDVQMGRGSARKASDDGGRGRGPGREACLLQIHPTVAERFSDVPLTALLGRDPIALSNCFRTGMRMLIRSRAYCAGEAPTAPWDWATVAMYVTGTSCTSPNEGKTGVRARLFRRVLAGARAKARTRPS